MAEKEKRIVFRLDEETWLRYDDKRHSQRTSFQELGEVLWANWAAQDAAAISSDQQRYIAALLYGMEHGSKDEKKTIEFALRKFVGKTETAQQKVPVTKAG